jgi:hypothetical protein
MPKTLPAVLLTASILLAVSPALAKKGDTRVMDARFLGASARRDAAGNVRMVVIVSEPGTRKRARLPVATKKRLVAKGSKRKVSVPSKELVEAVKKLEEGDLVTITAKDSGHGMKLQSIKPYDQKPGEDQPGAWVYIRHEPDAFRGERVMTLTIKKMGEQIVALVPNIKHPTGQTIPDPNMVETLDALKHGELADFELERKGAIHVVKGVYEYVPPLEVTFVKLVEPEKDDEDAVTYAVVEADGEERRVPLKTREVGRREIVDRRLLLFLRRAEEGDPLRVRVRPTDDGGVLVFVEKGKPREDKDADKG